MKNPILNLIFIGLCGIWLISFGGTSKANPFTCPEEESDDCVDKLDHPPILIFDYDDLINTLGGGREPGEVPAQKIKIDVEFKTKKEHGKNYWHASAKMLNLKNRKDQPIIFKIQNTDVDFHAISLTTESQTEGENAFAYSAVIHPNQTSYIVIPLENLTFGLKGNRLRFTCDQHEDHSGGEMNIIS